MPTAHPTPPLLLRRAEGSGALRWPTTVRLEWDSLALRVRFECVDDRAWATHTERDAPLWQEEVVEVFLAPGPADPRLYYELEVNPLGALFDARVRSPELERTTMEVDTTWDWPGIRWRADSAADRNPGEGRAYAREDWSAELELPWAGLGLEAPLPRLWRANFYRVERPGGPGDEDAAEGRGDEYSAWSPTLVEPADFHRPRHFGLLVLDDGSPLGSEAEATVLAIRNRGLPVARVPRARK